MKDEKFLKFVKESVYGVSQGNIFATKLDIIDAILHMNNKTFYDFCSDIDDCSIPEFDGILFTCKDCEKENNVPPDCDCTECCYDYWCKHYGIREEKEEWKD